MRILLTGSSGMVGTRLGEKLLAEGHELIGIDRRKNSWSEVIDAQTHLVDLTCWDQVSRFMEAQEKPIDLVLHLAANARVHDLVVEPRLAMENTSSLFHALEIARKLKVTRFVFSSSREVYGNEGEGRHAENEVEIKNSESPYTASKVFGEAMLHSYSCCYGMDFVTLRFSNVFGMYDDSDRIIPQWFEKATQNFPLTVYGKEKVLDFTYIDDTVAGVMLAIKNFDRAKGMTFNIASGRATSLIDAAEILISLTKSQSKLVIGESRPGEVMKFCADLSLAKEVLGYTPRYSFEEGLSQAIEWYSSELGQKVQHA